jgi:hypothetical protein
VHFLVKRILIENSNWANSCADVCGIKSRRDKMVCLEDIKMHCLEHGGGRPLRNPTYKWEDNIKIDNNRRYMAIDSSSWGRGFLSLLRHFVLPESLRVSV